MRRAAIRWLIATACASLSITASAQQGTAPAAATPQASDPLWGGQPRAQRGAPNVLLILTDDVGFGASSTFGGPVPTPTLDALARQGLRYNQFNTSALCAPTRAALLTGRNPHHVNMGQITPKPQPGYTTVIPRSAAMIPAVLRANGYSTAGFGKWHLTPQWEQGATGPFDRWPTGQGFDYFYGFMESDTDQWRPTIVENTTPRDPAAGLDPRSEGACAGQALLPLLCDRNGPFAAPGPVRLAGAVSRQVRSGVGQGPRGELRAAEGDGRRPRERHPDAPAGIPAGLGLAVRRPAPALRAADGGLRRGAGPCRS